MRIRTPDGREVPFEAVAEVHYVDSYRVIERVDRRRTAVISADVASGAEPAAIIAQIQAERLPQWQLRTPGLELTVEGERREEKEFTEAVFRLIGLSMIVIFGLMAVAFRSYVQPLLVLTAIPFGYAGSVLGHLLMGREISMFSLLGIVACAGVVVNDNLVLIDRLNVLRAGGVRPLDAVARAATDRFRAIVLTSVTTFVGMAPIMLERSSQAQFLIPMVISLSFGVLLATFVTLIFVPALYGVGVDLAERFRRLARPARKTDGRRELSGSS
jgi:multidrug efflux pump subunit AcrB